MTNSAGEAASESELHQHIRHYQELVGSDVHFAFQTIMDASDFDVVAFEALARGIHGEPAATVISRIPHDQRFAFDQACRIRALEAASRNELDADIHLNCSDIKPGNVSLVSQITLHMARRYGIDHTRIVLELSNLDTLASAGQLSEVRDTLGAAGLRTLADNFGRRNLDLRPLALLRPEQIKIDRALTQNIQEQAQQQALVRATLTLAGELGIRVVAAGIETKEEFQWLQEAGIERFQGYFFAQPGLDGENL
ncbi:MAG: EAL domain-containing protein [Wenzhouxiangella sp.]